MQANAAVCKTFIKPSKAVRRIGHGIALKGDPTAQAFVREQKRCIEGCPTSNVHTRAIPTYSAYPLREWLKAKVPFCLNTDNRTVSNTTLTNEYLQMAHHCDMTESEMRLNETAAQHSFAEAADKAVLLKKFKNGNSNKHGR